MSADARAVVAYLDTTLAGGADANAVRNFVRKFGLDDRVSEEDIQNLLRCHGDGGGKLDVRAVEGLLAEHRTVTSQAAQEALLALRDSNSADAGSGVSEADALVAALSDMPAGQGQPPSVSRTDAAKLVAGSSGGNTDGIVDHAKFLALAEAGDQAQQ